MADGQSAFAPKPRYLWTEFFRCFWIALDPRKLLVAAAGILATSFGWWLLSSVTWGMAGEEPKADSAIYSRTAMVNKLGKQTDGSEFADEIYAAEGAKRFHRDHAQYELLKSLAGPDGRMRVLPWDERRGDNPYLLLQNFVGGNAEQRRAILTGFIPNQAPVLLEPMVKLLLPVFVVTNPDATFGTKLYAFLCLIWSLAVWGFAGGVITRIAAVQLSGKDRISLSEAVQFVQRRYVAYLGSPLLPIAIILACTFALVVYGLIGMIPFLGDVIFLALLFPIILFFGLVMAVVLISLIGYPLMYSTLSVEGSDIFDALSRAWNYVFTAPGRFFGYGLIAVLFGMAATFVVVLGGSLSVYLGKWGVSTTASTLRESHTPDYLFVNAPKTLGWRELLTRGSDVEVKSDGSYKNPEAADKYLKSYWSYHTFSTWVVSFWLFLTLLLMLGFSYSYFWSASTVLYQLMRHVVDDTELDEIYLEQDQPDQPLTPPSAPVINPPPGGTSLPMVPTTPPDAPASPPAAPSAPPPATIPMSPPSAEGPKT